jgi:hypothetical protein
MSFLTAQGIAPLSLELLKRKLVLPMTVSRVSPSAFVGPNGGTVTVRVRQPRTANVQSTPGADVSGNFTAIAEVPVDVALKHLYDGTPLSDEELTYELADFGSQVLEPLTTSVATGAENQLATALNALTLDGEIEFAATASNDDTRAVVLAARERLTSDEVPAGNRFLAVSPSIATRLLTVPELVQVDASGTASALRDATIGRYYGFTVVESTGLTPDTCVAYHRSGAVWANRAPAEASGADSSTTSSDGISLRTVRDFDANTLSELCVVSTFAGASVVVDDESPGSGESGTPRVIRIGVGS